MNSCHGYVVSSRGVPASEGALSETDDGEVERASHFSHPLWWKPAEVSLCSACWGRGPRTDDRGPRTEGRSAWMNARLNI